MKLTELLENENLDELFKKNVGLEDGERMFDKSFTINGKTYLLSFYPGPRTSEYGLEFGFSLDGSKDSMGITGTGDELDVFSAAVKLLKEFMNSKWQKRFYFTAKLSEHSRVKLYDRMAKRVIREIPGWEFETFSDDRNKTYAFQREGLDD
jgi:hypothetical protein